MISRTDSNNIGTVPVNATKTENDNFDAKVLHYLKANHPEGNLQSILEKLKALSPNSPLTLITLSNAMNAINAKMRDDPAHQEYANKILYKKAMQLIGTNMFYTNMMNEIFFPTDEENIKPEKW
ncbi:MAG: hypothetical protein ACMZI0_17770 [Symbiopectobacterium sp.]|uniref:hypothetical protein n=1 Tax=Symbiopectobacterium sp. TaxID=2952789 RepID=UPI0039EB0B7C